MPNIKPLVSIILGAFLLIVVSSVLYTNNLVRQLTLEEEQRMQIWAQATERLILAGPEEDIDFYTTIIERNTTIPVYMTDKEGNILYMRNVKKPVKDVTKLHGPIPIEFVDDQGQAISQYIYYEQSTLLSSLKRVPYAQFAVILIFIVLSVFALISTQRNEQNRVWVGLSKETAHQLGTPISSLNAWQMLLESRYPKDELIPQMRTDIDRLQVIADRFSKVGSEPELEDTELIPVLREAIQYMRTRTSDKVNVTFSAAQLSQFPLEPVKDANVRVMLNKPLFEWVIENLIKNAIDAMDGVGQIECVLYDREQSVIIDVTDHGKGMNRRTQRRVFIPGYTTKQRGWGLGLSLSKRIVEQYHRGKLLLKDSQPGRGTTFRIILEKTIDS